MRQNDDSIDVRTVLRQGSIANTNAAAYSPIAITANMTSGTNNLAVTNTGHAFLPKTPEQFTHDADGNLISDGRWAYTWDAENRLIAIETLPNLPTNIPVQKLLFQYDAQSRRISKECSGVTSLDSGIAPIARRQPTHQTHRCGRYFLGLRLR